MTPPTNIDGTDISGATIDGQTVKEITVDGDTVFTAIPNTVVDRGSDTGTQTNAANNVGLTFSTSQNWVSFQAEISSNTTTDSGEDMIIGDTNGTNVASVNLSGTTSGDIITFSNVNLQANTAYSIYITSSSNTNYGQTKPSFPVTSSDGNLSITAGWVNGSANTNTAWCIRKIGNINL